MVYMYSLTINVQTYDILFDFVILCSIPFIYILPIWLIISSMSIVLYFIYLHNDIVI